MAEVFGGDHVSIVLEHPLGIFEICNVLLHVRHDFVDILALS